MPFSFPFDFHKEITVSQDPASVFDFLKNYPQALPDFFPGLRRFEEENPKVYFWEFDAIKYRGSQLTISFKTRFEESSSLIVIHPYGSTSETRLAGEWRVFPEPDGCRIKMHFHLDFSVPLPKLMKAMIAPLATLELSKLFEHYAKNLHDHFE